MRLWGTWWRRQRNSKAARRPYRRPVLGVEALETRLTPANPAILIAINGATPRLLDQYLATGALGQGGLALLANQGLEARQNLTVTPSLTAPSLTAIATGSIAARNDVPADVFHLVSSPLASDVSGFAAPIGGYTPGAPPAPAATPTAVPDWVTLRAAGKKVVSVSFPGADGADITVPGLATSTVVQPASARTVDYTVPAETGVGLDAAGFSLTAANFTQATQALVDKFTAAGRTSFSPIEVTTAPVETFTVGDVTYRILAAALDTTNNSTIDYDTLVFFDQTLSIPPGPFVLPSTGPAYVKASDRTSAPFYLEGSSLKAETAFYVSALTTDLSVVRFARYAPAALPRNAAVLANVDDVNNSVGAAASLPDFKILERLAPGFAAFPDTELETIFQDQVRAFVDYQTRVALRAIAQNPTADLVQVDVGGLFAAERQFLLTDARQATDPANPLTIAAGQDTAKVARYQGYVLADYRAVDQAVQRIIQAVGTDAAGKPKNDVFVVSDHGVAAVHTAVNINNYLAAKGYDPTKVRAVVSGATVNVYINLQGREAGGTVARAEYLTLRQRLTIDLQALADTNATYTQGAGSVAVFGNVFARPVPSDVNDPTFGLGTNELTGQDSGDVAGVLKAGYTFEATQTPLTARQGDTSNTVTTTLSAALAAADTTLTVAAATNFPTTAPFTIRIDNEQLTVTAGAGTVTWTVTRGVNGTTAAAHASGATIVNVVPAATTTLSASLDAATTTVTVASAASFPSSGSFTIQIDREQMIVTAGAGTTVWTVTRGANGTTPVAHAQGATVLNPGSVVFSVPNFYGASGYDPNLADLSAVFLAAGPDVGHGVLAQVHNIDVAPTIEKLLGVTPAATVQGTAITLTTPSTAPQTVNDTVTVQGNGQPKTIDVLANDTVGASGGTLSVLSVTQPAHGTAVVAPDGRTVLYTPTNGYVGPDSFSYVAGSTVQVATLPRQILGTVNGVPIYDGYGTALALVPGTTNEFYTLTDRGPNVAAAAANTRVFPFPTLPPEIARFRVEDGRVIKLSSLPLKDANGRFLTGLPNGTGNGGTGETATDAGGNALAADPIGVNPAGLVALADGTFWVAEEYGPSLIHFDSTGKTLEVVTPFANNNSGHKLPQVFRNRVANQGLTGLTVTPDGRTLVAIMQSALANGITAAEAATTPAVRILTYDLSAATTALSASLDATTTTAFVASAANFPTAVPFTIRIDNEQLTVTAGAGTTAWTVTRGANGTTAAAHPQGAVVVNIGAVTHQYLYLLDDPATFKTSVGDIVAVDATTFYVSEGDDAFPGDPAGAAQVKKVYRISLAGAKDVSDASDTVGGFNLKGQTPEAFVKNLTTAQAQAALQAAGAAPVTKTLAVDLLKDLGPLTTAYAHNKVAGLALVDGGNRLVVSNFDDFGITGTSPASNGVAPKPVPTLPGTPADFTQLLYVDLRNLPAQSASATVAVTVTATRTANQNYVNQLYLDLLGRPADGGGLAFWSGILDRGGARLAVVAGIQGTQEYRGHLVDQAFRSLLGRPADAGAATAFASLLAGGGTLTDVRSLVIGSAEYYQKHGATTVGFLQGLFPDLLGRPLDPASQASLSVPLNAGAPRADFARQVAGSDEALGQVVQNLFQASLRRRTPDVSYFRNLLKSGAREENVLAGILASDEYYGVAQRLQQ